MCDFFELFYFETREVLLPTIPEENPVGMMVALFVISAENPGRSRERPGFSALNHYNNSTNRLVDKLITAPYRNAEL